MRGKLAVEMGYLQLSQEAGVQRIRLSAPGSRNVLDAGMAAGLLEALHHAEGEAILLEAEGPVFCAGDEATPQLVELLRFREWVRLPVVASVQGPAAAGGVALIANAHLALGAQGCSFVLSEIRSGRWPEAGWQALERAIGERRLRALALTGRVFSSQEALAWGLVHELCPAFELEDRAMATAEHLALMGVRRWLAQPGG